MAHFAKLDENNVVLEVHVVNNEELLVDGVESEQKGIEFLIEWSQGYTNWKQTSYSNSFRNRFARIGFIYSRQLDVFIPPQPFPSWALNQNTLEWEPPIPMPTPGIYIWNEQTRSWVPDMIVGVEVFE